MLTYKIDKSDGTAKYISLYRHIKSDIQNGVLLPGEKLPSKRAIAEHLGISVITAENAYLALLDEGYIISREKSGYYVASLSDLLLPRKGRPSPVVSVSENLSPSLPEGWIKTMRRVLSDAEGALSVRQDYHGCAVLRNALSGYLLRYRGIEASPNSIIICSGAEDIYQKAVLLLGRERIFGIENPSYYKISMVYGDCGVKTEPLDIGTDGIESEMLKKTDADVLHVTPFDSFPSGITASAAKRREYLLWANSGDRIIIEDDYDSEFSVGKKPLETLFSTGGNEKGRVIYLNTFSKSISPSVRIGYMIIPDFLKNICEEKLGGYSCSVPVFDQYVIARYISDGLFERHINRSRRRLREKQNAEKV